MKRIRILDALIDDVDMREAVRRVDALARAGCPALVVTPNVDHVMKLRRDPAFRAVYDDADLVLADGMPLLWAARFLGTPLRERVAGSDLFPELCALAARRGYKVFFLGGRPGAALGAAEAMRRRYPALRVVGTYCPPVGFEHDAHENAKAVNVVRESGADLVFVGLGAPKQEKWMHAHRLLYRAPVSLGIGVTFEFEAGLVRRAPRWMRSAGLEWLWRLAMEPGRLWRRYLVEDLPFFAHVLAEKLSGRRRPAPPRSGPPRRETHPSAA